MSDEPLLTLRDLADRLDLPESTVRYYRDAFLDLIPSVGTGRRRRYPADALAVLRSIAKGYAAGLPRREILRRLEGPAVAEPVAQESSSPRRPISSDTAEITNLDLLAAIVDGEREQREALWQMAQEIVRLAGVLEGQERVLTEIAEHTGITAGAAAPVFDAAPPPVPALERGPAAEAQPVPRQSAAPPVPPAPTAPPAPAEAPAPPAASPVPAPVAEPPAPPVGPPATAALPLVAATAGETTAPDEAPVPPPEPKPAPPVPTPPPVVGRAHDIDRLRQELEAERALVERLREAKLKLEQRATDAEAALEEQRPRRRSVIDRLLGGDRPEP